VETQWFIEDIPYKGKNRIYHPVADGKPNFAITLATSEQLTVIGAIRFEALHGEVYTSVI